MLEIQLMRPSSFLHLLGLVLLILLPLCIAQNDVLTYTFVIEETTYKKLCINDISVLTVNGMLPGPPLRLTYGQTLKVNVHNRAPYGVTIHWHGVKQPRNPWSDGPVYITQCPIAPGSNFTYEIILSDEEGTLWWHAHSDWSRATVHGPIFIRPTHGRQYPYPIIPDAEQQLIFGSWFERNVMNMVNDYWEQGSDFYQPDALTINGQPGDQYMTETCTADMFSMEVEFNKTYLLRIINAAMNEDLTFAVANHTLIVVGSDAAYLDPIYTDHIMISPGQTMDVLLIANQTPSHYYMAAEYRALYYRNTTGIIRYSGTYEPPTQALLPNLPTSNTVANFTQQFRALNSIEHPTDVPQTVDKRIFMTVSLNNMTCEANKTCSYRNAASLNNVTFVTPKVDVLQAYWSNIADVYKTDFPNEPLRKFDYTNSSNDGIGRFSMVNGTRVFVVDYNSTVEIVLQGTNVVAAAPHPIHLHGYSFYKVAWGTGNYNESNVNYISNPPLINTVALPRLGWTAIRFRADNPGVWFMHCHLERHTTFGMDAIMIVKNGSTEATSIRPPHFNLTGSCE